jgi:mRNA interferase RelE/StbE
MPDLWFRPASYRALVALPAEIRGRVLAAILALQENARPVGCEKLEGSDAWRIRVGDYRVVYRIDDADGTVTITDIGPRRDIYRRR